MNSNSAIIVPPPAPASATLSNDIRGIKPPVEIPNPWLWVWVGVAVVALIAMAFLARRYFQKQQAARSIIPPVPAHVRARQRLNAAQSLLHDPRAFCIMVSDTIRTYLEERFSFHAPDRTTEEFMLELHGSDLLLPDQKDSLSNFLEGCDLVKFARYEPTEEELRRLLDSALRLVDETQFEPVNANAT